MPDKLLAFNDSARAVMNFSHLYLTEYPDLTRDASGEVCDQIVLEGAVSDLFGIDAVIGHNDLIWISDFGRRLDDVLRSSAGGNQWTFVSGISDQFMTHGYCAPAHWLVHRSESMLNQRDQNGTLHPNIQGHNAYARQILQALITDGIGTSNALSFIPSAAVIPPIPL